MARIVGGQQKIIVPPSLRQNILKECHNVSFTGHVGMRKTLELVDRQFYWRGLRGDTIQYVKTCQKIKGDYCGFLRDDSDSINLYFVLIERGSRSQNLEQRLAKGWLLLTFADMVKEAGCETNILISISQ